MSSKSRSPALLPALPWATLADKLPVRLPRRAWATALALLGFTYVFMFAVVHPFVDTRTCIAVLPDPLFSVIAYDHRWYLVSHELYYFVNATVTAAMIALAVRGDHRYLLRFLLGISVMGLCRSLTLVLVPLCRATIAPGTAALASVPTVDLWLFDLPVRIWAANDLVFSGHVAEFLIMYLVARDWPRWVRVALVLVQVLQAYALIATRGHYTIDVVVAIPFAVVADLVAVLVLEKLVAGRAAGTPPAA